MIRGAPLTAIIPVRGGSKGIPRKNLRRVGNDSLLERAIKFAKNSPRIDRTIVTTDDPEMHEVATRYGVQSPSLRPAHLADDSATATTVVEHVLQECSVTDGYLLILQVTSPFRRLGDLEDLCTAYEQSQAEAIVSLVTIDEPRPEKMKRIVDGRIEPYMAVGFEGPRQALPQPYKLNGAFYMISLEAFRRERRFVPLSSIPFVMPEERSHNLDSMTDWNIMEAMIAAERWTLEEYT
jgi:CMP-N,N'-diacetyllegionaminic acid synthase